MRAINPKNQELVAEYGETPSEDVAIRLSAAHQAFASWRRTPLADRRGPMLELARLLRERRRTLAELMANEMGKACREGEAEVEKCAVVAEYYGDQAESLLAPLPIATEARTSYVCYQPLGPVLAVMPWNFPCWQVLRFAAPALMAGNVALLKHASNVPGTAVALEDLFRQAGFPVGVFTTLLVGAARVAALVADPRVAAVTLTGSTPAGRQVAEQAGFALKKTVLELGGSDPYVILEDADLDLAAREGAKSRLINAGQSCIAAKRFIVVAEVYEAFTEALVAHMAKVRVGDPLDENTEMGPMARLDLRDELHDQVSRSVAHGAVAVLGGTVPEGTGAFYPPTVLKEVGPGMPAYEEELFGPVAAVIPARDEADALRVANDTTFGLGAAVFTRDLARGERIARDGLDAGCCFVNAFVRSDPRLPFGGIKESGHGRELGPLGILEFVNAKTVYVGPG